MFRKSMYLAVALAVILMSGVPAHAAGAPHKQPAIEKDFGGFFLQAWQWVQSLWAGPCMDPDGKCTNATADTEKGACIDPNGKCTSGGTALNPAIGRTLANSDAGPCIDPDGRCSTAPH